MKKAISIFLVLIFILGLIPYSALAADEILAVVVLNIDAPKDGAEFDRFADIPNGQPYKIFSQPEWYDETDKRFLETGDTFEDGHIYTVNVWLEANDGYEFKSTTTTDVKASINGKTAEAGKAYEYQRWAMVVVSYTFPAVEKAKPVGRVEIEISKPKAGETVSYDAKLTGEGVRLMTRIPDLKDVYKNAINGIEWDDETANHNMKKGETFTVGHEYGLSIFIEPEAGYKLDNTNKDYSVTINGSKALPIDGFGEDRRGYYISYDCIGEIGAVNFNIVEPEVGSAPFFKGYAENGNVNWEVTDLSYFDKSTREHLEAYDTFEEGHYYEIYFRMQAKDGYDFTKDENGNFDQSKITINGHTPSDSGYFSNVWRTGFVKSCYGPLKKNSENLPLTLRDDELVNDAVQSIYLYDLEKPKVGATPDYITVWFSEYYYPVMSSTEVEKWGVCWKNVTTGKDLAVENSEFEAGNEYEVHIRVTTNYKMKQNGIKAYVDGVEPDKIINIKENEATLVYNFGTLGEKKSEAQTEPEKPTESEKPTETPAETPTEMPSEKPTESPTETPSDSKVTFADVPSSAYYYEAVMWAAENGITGGTGNGKFSPDNVCTRAQVVTFLWRAAGSPEPKSSTNPFTDVKSSDYFYKAVLWAVENNITGGTGNGKFSPNDNCIRAQVVTFLHRAAKSPAPKSNVNPFSDVAETEYYYKPVLWAVENNITGGTGNGKFSPDGACTRAQVVTFLYRYMGK